MQRGPLTDQIIVALPSMSPQLRAAARFVLDRPNEVALLSMREQARQAGVQPHTMTRLAQRLGLSGFDEIKALYQESVRVGALGFSEKAGAQMQSQRFKGERALAAEIAVTIGHQIARLAEPEMLDRFVAIADLLESAERILCLGLRTCHAVVAQFAYVMGFLGERTVLLDAAAGIGLDPLQSVTSRDVLIAVSVAPYARATVEAVQYAADKNVPIVAITDSFVSPLAALARETILVPTESPSFYHTIAPAFVVGEVLAALMAGRGGEKSLAAIRRREAQMEAFGVHWRHPRTRVAP
ncbi:MurR/RpiR family transcriptional regulator [Bradyrhizobium liaoningense]|uniref:MurR/RpiR family transcriptional regulator n=1 Tax=Bradyrhizobium liaoningense TaxID=43992 RepID=UPI001BA684BE|nr:MurR/RpiR family transcriptional regulator [Bradyrhizobium liaoningense]MBR0706975.1 MurR/RpiR family transcriptional regulator [Bradyrhizobium liaoningense]